MTDAERVEARARLLLEHCREKNMRLSGDHRVGEADAAALLGVHVDTLRRWRAEGGAPDHFRIGGAISYCVHSLAGFIVLCHCSSGHERADGGSRR
jgi:hypothetical protein